MPDSNSPIIPGRRAGVYSRDKWYDRDKWQSLCDRDGTDSHRAPPPPFKDPENLASKLMSVLKEMVPAISVAETEIRQNWTLLVGDAVAKHTSPGKIENHTLFVTVRGAIWYSQLCHVGTGEMLKNIQSKIGCEEVRAIKFRPGV